MAKPKKEKQPLKVKFDLAELIAKVNLKYGEGSIVLASNAKNLSVSFISTGCYALDFAVGGGIPENRITQLVGGFSSGKTTISLKAVAEFQRKYPHGYAFYIDVENALDIGYAKRLGVNLERFLIIRPDSGEQAVDILMEMLKQDEDIFGVVDSIPAIVPLNEIEASVDQNFMGKHPQLINRMVKMCSHRLKKSMTNEKAPSTTIILINQIREKVGLVFGNPETTPGGRGKDFFSALIITLRGSDKIHEEFEKNGIKRKILVGRMFHATVSKNKVGGRPFEETEYTYWTKTLGEHRFGTFDNESILLEFGLFHDVIQIGPAPKKGKAPMVFTCKHGEIRYAQDSAFVSALRAKPKTARALYKAILKKVYEENTQETTETIEPAVDETSEIVEG